MSSRIAGVCVIPLLLWAASARALDYAAVASPSAILYDSPSAQGKKLYVISRYTPLELIVTLSDWVKVRNQDGTLGWVEKRALGATRYVVVTVPIAQVRQRPDANAPIVFEARKQVALQFLEDTAAGWIRVRHLGGASGYVKASAVWGD